MNYEGTIIDLFNNIVIICVFIIIWESNHAQIKLKQIIRPLTALVLTFSLFKI